MVEGALSPNLHIQVSHVEGVLLDKGPPVRHVVPHEHGEYLVRIRVGGYVTRTMCRRSGSMVVSTTARGSFRQGPCNAVWRALPCPHL